MDRVKKIGFSLFLILVISFNVSNAELLENTIGRSKEDKLIVNEEGARYVLVKGEKVRVGSKIDGEVNFFDVEGNLFTVSEEDLDLIYIPKNFDNILDEKTIERNEVINSAFYKLNKPYVYGGVGPESYDCSGFTYQIYKNELGISLNRVARDQFKNGIAINKQDLQPGDLVFFRSNGVTIGHVGIYVGDGNMIHASSGAGKVIVSNIETPWYKTNYAGARRLIY